jgi:2-polyprenyl-3-methyl-5-hydroxy-6-metoxy-1,4-benzoquinol methylase
MEEITKRDFGVRYSCIRLFDIQLKCMNKEKDILSSWYANASNWIDLIAQNGIESRKLATNQAIVDAVLDVKPATVLDIGCGEGWLGSVLSGNNILVTGVDAIPALIDNARQKVQGHFLVASYEEIASGTTAIKGPFDAVVINFALIGKESTEKLVAALPAYLSPQGTLFIQTLHPHHRKAVNDYTTGWKTGSWDGLGPQFTQPYEWYFRTMEDWLQLLKDSGFGRVEVKEVFHPGTGQPLSVVFQCHI